WINFKLAALLVCNLQLSVVKLKVGDKARLYIFLETLCVFVFDDVNLSTPNFAPCFHRCCNYESFPVERRRIRDAFFGHWLDWFRRGTFSQHESDQAQQQCRNHQDSSSSGKI